MITLLMWDITYYEVYYTNYITDMAYLYPMLNL